MIASPAEVLASFLVARGLVSRPASKTNWPVTTTGMPEDLPDNRVSISNPEAEIQGKNFRTGETYISPVCQIRVRSVPADVGYTKLNDILQILMPVSAVTIITKVPTTESITLVAVNLVSGPAYMGQDEKSQRQHHVINVKIVFVPGE